MPDQQAAQLAVGGADAARFVPLLVPVHVRQRALGGKPELQQPKPLRVVGDATQQPVLAGGHLLVIVGPRIDPRRRTLKQKQLRDRGGDCRHRLKGRRASTDHRYALAGQINRLIPARGMKRGAAKRVPAGDLRQPRAIELADGADHGVGAERRALLPAGAPGMERPDLAPLVEREALDFGGEADPVANAEPGGALAKVLQEYRLGGKELRPILGCERVGIGVIGRVDAAAGVGVLQPGAAHVGVLLEHGVGDARLLQAMRRQDSRHTGADHRHVEAGAPLRRHLAEEAGGAGVAAGQPEFGHQELDVVLPERPADEETGHLMHLFAGRRRRRAQPAVAVGGDDFQGAGAHLLLLRPAEPHLRVAPDHARSNLPSEQLEVAGEMGQRRQQRGDVGVRQSIPYGRVVGRNRLPRVERGARPLPYAACISHVRNETPYRRPAQALPCTQPRSQPATGRRPTT